MANREDPASDVDPLYECIDCHKHVDDPDGQLCPDCGGYLQNIGTPRSQ